MSGFTPKGFLSLPAVFETAGEHLYPDSWTGAETSAEVLGFDQRRFVGEVDAYMVRWIVHWQAPDKAVGTEARDAKASGEGLTAWRRRRRRLLGRDQEEEWQEAEKILAEAQFAITLRREGGPGWRRWKDGAFRSSLPLELSESDVEAIAAAEAEYRGDHQELVDAHERMTGTTAWLCQQLCGTPPEHEDAIHAIEVYSDGKIRSIDPRVWARPEAPDLIKAALEAGDQGLMAKAGGGVSGQLFVSDENLIAPCPDSQPEEPATSAPSARETRPRKLRKGRPPGVGGYQKQDEPLVGRMREMVKNGKSPWQAALEVAPDAPGGGTEKSKAKRLLRRYKKETQNDSSDNTD